MGEIRYATRSLLRTPTLTVTALLIMALGIGATTAMFSVANSVLFRPLPFAAPERLVQFGTVGVLEFRAYREQSRSFEALVSYRAVNKLSTTSRNPNGSQPSRPNASCSICSVSARLPAARSIRTIR